MKKILSIILALLWSNVGSAEDYKWKISTISDGQTVLASMNGNVTHGDTLMFILKNSNQGKCDYVQPTFSFYTMAKNPDIKKILSWKPMVNFDKGFKITVNSYKKLV